MLKGKWKKDKNGINYITDPKEGDLIKLVEDETGEAESDSLEIVTEVGEAKYNKDLSAATVYIEKGKLIISFIVYDKE